MQDTPDVVLMTAVEMYAKLAPNPSAAAFRLVAEVLSDSPPAELSELNLLQIRRKVVLNLAAYSDLRPILGLDSGSYQLLQSPQAVVVDEVRRRASHFLNLVADRLEVLSQQGPAN